MNTATVFSVPAGPPLPVVSGSFVVWPRALPTIGGGCRVYAVLPALRDGGEGPAFLCAPEGTARPHEDLPLLGFPMEGARDSLMDVRRTWGGELLAVVCLGSSPLRYQDVTGRAWACERAHLSPEGRVLLDLLDRLYGREAQLVTVFDA